MTPGCAAAAGWIGPCGSAGIGCPGNTAVTPGETAGVEVTGGAPGTLWGTLGVKFSQRSIR
jgi:hypothetical protein